MSISKEKNSFETRLMNFFEENGVEWDSTQEEADFLQLVENDMKKEFINKVITVIILFFIFVFVIFAGIVKYRIEEKKFENAVFLYEEGELKESLEIFWEVKNFRNAEFYITLIASEIASGELEREKDGENQYGRKE